MTRFDVFPYAGERDMLECRLTELADVPDMVHVLVEADVTHAGNPKSYDVDDYTFGARFERWADRLVIIRATDMPTGPDAWDREHAQREAAMPWLRANGHPDDLVFHGDVDEIPTVLAATYTNPRGVAGLMQRFHPFAVDWRHPDDWQGTTVTALRNVSTLSTLRDARLSPAATVIPDAGWHFSWVGNEDARHRKIDSFCHQEIRPTWEPHLEDCYATGLHVDGAPLAPVDVDDEWPRWVASRDCPVDWFRPRDVARPRPTVAPAQIVGPVPT